MRRMHHQGNAGSGSGGPEPVGGAAGQEFLLLFRMEGEAQAEHAVGARQRQEFRPALGRFQRDAAHDGEPIRIALGRREHHVVPVALPGGRHEDGARHAGRIHFFQKASRP